MIPMRMTELMMKQLRTNVVQTNSRHHQSSTLLYRRLRILNHHVVTNRIVFPIETLPLDLLQTRGQRGLGKTVDYKKRNNGVALLRHSEEEDTPPRVRLMSYRTPNYIADYSDAVAIDIALSKLDIDDNQMMHELESTILHIFRAMQTSDPDINNNVNADIPNDELIDSIARGAPSYQN